jgi:hypothetical protein
MERKMKKDNWFLTQVTTCLLDLAASSFFTGKKRNYLFILTFTIIVTCLLGIPANAESIIGKSVSIDYYGFAFYQEPVYQSGKVEVINPGAEFIARAPGDGADLFSIDISENTITITGLDSCSDDLRLKFEWNFVIDSPSPITFDGAELVSSSLFSIPPFTFPVNPNVSFDIATNSILVSRYISAGVGTAVVNKGGQAIIEFTTTPEPATLFLLGLGSLSLLRKRRR